MNDFLVGIKNKWADTSAIEQRKRLYFEVGTILWYRVAYDQVLHYKRGQMYNQKERFCIGEWGTKTMRFGAIKALTSEEDKNKFVKIAQAELRDAGFGTCEVGVYPDAVLVRL